MIQMRVDLLHADYVPISGKWRWQYSIVFSARRGSPSPWRRAHCNYLDVVIRTLVNGNDSRTEAVLVK